MTDPETIQRVLREHREAREREASLRLPLDGEIDVRPAACLEQPCKNNPRASNAGRGLCEKHLRKLTARVNAGETSWLAEETAGRCRPAQTLKVSPWRKGRKT